MKKFITVLLSLVLLSFYPIDAYASSQAKPDNEAITDTQLSEIWLESEKTLNTDQSIEGEFYSTTLKLNDKTYEVEDTISEDLSEVNSKFYKIEDKQKIYIGSMVTVLNNDNDLLNVDIYENGKIISQEKVNIPTNDVKSNNLNTNNNLNPAMYSASANSANCKMEYKWSNPDTSYGSTKILKYTTGAIIAVLATAAGSPLAAGLGNLANSIIQDKIPLVYTKMTIWTYLERSSCSPIYPHWIPAGKYKYHTKYYSDKNRTQLINETNYIDG
ncbi:hypothetical protein ACKRLN_07975 [Anaerococcus sp. DFU013_CI05]|uniref:hypothetical protein n=1 Tax=Anaerococcus sp. AH8042_DFU013_CI05 TaxID=3385202 RepID=UPI003A522CDD